MSILIFYTTHSSEEAAWQLANLLLEKKWIACVNILPIQSASWWQGQVENADEIVALFKTLPEMEEKIVAMIEKHHSYEVPCIISWKAEANKAYVEWIRSIVVLN